MYNSNLVKILYSCKQLSEKLTGLCFFEFFPFDNVVEELAVRYVFHNQEQLFRCLDDFVKLDNMRVSYYF